jgi:hypothetical protein
VRYPDRFPRTLFIGTRTLGRLRWALGRGYARAAV